MTKTPRRCPNTKRGVFNPLYEHCRFCVNIGMRLSQLNEFIEPRSLYQDAQAALLARLRDLIRSRVIARATPDEWWGRHVIDAILAALTPLVMQSQPDTSRKLFFDVKVIDNDRNPVPGGAIQPYLGGGAMITINVPRSWISGSTARFETRIQRDPNSFIRPLARTFVHEMKHLDDILRGEHGKPMDGGRDSIRLQHAILKTQNTRRMSGWDQRSWGNMARNSTGYYDRSEMERAKQILYLTQNNEVAAHAINAAQEMIDAVGDARTALDVFRPENKQRLHRLVYGGLVPHLEQYWHFVRNDGADTGADSWRAFLKAVYRYIKDEASDVAV